MGGLGDDTACVGSRPARGAFRGLGATPEWMGTQQAPSLAGASSSLPLRTLNQGLFLPPRPHSKESSRGTTGSSALGSECAFLRAELDQPGRAPRLRGGPSSRERAGRVASAYPGASPGGSPSTASAWLRRRAGLGSRPTSRRGVHSRSPPACGAQGGWGRPGRRQLGLRRTCRRRLASAVAALLSGFTHADRFRRSDRPLRRRAFRRGRLGHRRTKPRLSAPLPRQPRDGALRGAGASASSGGECPGLNEAHGVWCTGRQRRLAGTACKPGVGALGEQATGP